MESEIRKRLFNESETVLVVGRPTITAALGLISSCEHCNEPNAQTPIESILDVATGRDRTCTSYIFSEPVFCPKCRREIKEGDIVERAGGIEIENEVAGSRHK